MSGDSLAPAEWTRSGKSIARHLITPEYPPQPGGVSEYTKLVAEGLADAGEEVHVWCPFLLDERTEQAGVVVHGKLGGVTPASLRRLGQQLDRFPAPRRVLVQWLPHGYGYRSMNLPFCVWLWNRSRRRGDRVEIMVHEPFLAFEDGSWRQNAAALVHRLMTVILLRAAERVWVSIPRWGSLLRPYLLGRQIPFEWLPLPSNITFVNDPETTQTIRRRCAHEGALLLGHFGTYSRPVVSVLEPILLKLADHSHRHSILLMGIGSEDLQRRLIKREPELSPRLHATGALSPEGVSCHLSACDLLIQPYPDGVSTRRTSFMAGLSHGKPILTTSGPSTEPLWMQLGAAALAPVGDIDAFVKHLNLLCVDSSERARLGQAARKLYEDRFDIAWTATALRNSTIRKYPACVS
jgi:glycosyltransferase involved in cell wall biosynthesis